MKTFVERNVIEQYLRNTLYDLHRENAAYKEINFDSVGCEAAIAELELVWQTLLEEDAPTKEKLFKEWN